MTTLLYPNVVENCINLLDAYKADDYQVILDNEFTLSKGLCYNLNLYEIHTVTRMGLVALWEGYDENLSITFFISGKENHHPILTNPRRVEFVKYVLPQLQKLVKTTSHSSSEDILDKLLRTKNCVTRSSYLDILHSRAQRGEFLAKVILVGLQSKMCENYFKEFSNNYNLY